MADNTDELPLFIPQLPAQFMQDKVIVGNGNIVGSTAQNVIVNGIGNYVGDFCDNVNLFNCSGCIVEPYTSGVIMLGSSGVVTGESGAYYVRNNALSPSGEVTTTAVQVNADYTATTSDYVLFINGAGITVTFPYGDLLGFEKTWIVKNISDGDAYIYTAGLDGFDLFSGGTPVNTITLSSGDSYTLYAIYDGLFIL